MTLGRKFVGSHHSMGLIKHDKLRLCLYIEKKSYKSNDNTEKCVAIDLWIMLSDEKRNNNLKIQFLQEEDKDISLESSPN